MVSKIEKYDLCIGCGLCSSLLGNEKCIMRLGDDGFYYPCISNPLDKDDKRIIRSICPGIKVHGDSHQSIWGNVKEVVEGWSKDSALRHKSASGGVVSSLAIYMLESGLADAVLQVGVSEDSYLYNEMKISRNKEDVVRNAQSRYAPALTLVNIKQILDSTTERFVFIGKPCDIAGLKNVIELYPNYRDRFVLFISIFCAGMPSYKASKDAWKKSGRDDDPEFLKYRGDGWPGFFRATWKDGQEFKLSYHESWGQILGRQLGYRCKICPDGIGMLADVAVGDSWNTRNGYPDFTESDGRSFVFVRTDRGKEAMNSAKSHDYLEYHELSVDKIKDMQAYQYKRRKLIGWRLIPVWFATLGIIDFKGLGIMKQAKSADMKSAFSNLVGSVKRMARVIWGGVVFVKSDIQLLIAFMQDYRQYRKVSLFRQSPYRENKMNARMMLIGHSLEKGMSFATKKAGWGREKAIQLCSIMTMFIKKNPVSEEFVSCLNILKAYRDDVDSCKQPEVTEKLDSLIFDYHDYLKEGYAGVKDVIKPDSFDEQIILNFYQTRASVRYFSDEPVTQEEIDNAIAIARTTPTACNRQSSRIYTICNKDRMKQVLDLQKGNQGWADNATAMFIVTGRVSCFGGITERQQVYIDGGLYAMNFVMGLHLYGVASCFKMYIRDKKSQNKLMQICGIPGDEVPIVIVMAGHYRKEAVKDPISRRFDHTDIKVS